MNEHASEAAGRERGVSSFFARLLNRRVGGLSGGVGRAAAMNHSFLIFLLIVTFSYVVFHMTYDARGLSWLITINLAAAAGYAVGIVVVRLGHQTSASVIALSVALVHIMLATPILGWQSGFHLYLVAGGQLVLMLFTDYQRALRWVFVILAAVAFVYCQVMLPSTRANYLMEPEVLGILFSVNAVLTAGLMYILAALAHLRSTSASRAAAASAERAEYLANTDALTGLANRRPVMDHLEQLSADPEARYCVGLADLDLFKALNDEYGHACGDRVLATLGERLGGQMRPSDSLGRWGGEEFVFVLPRVHLADAVVIMERMRATVGEHVVPCSGHSHHVTISIGVAERAPAAMSHRVLKHADDALYEAKQSGRNRVRVVMAIDDDDEILAPGHVAINPGGGEGHRTHRPAS